MAQIRIFDYHAPRTTDLLNTRWDRAFPESVTEGMAVSKGTGDFDINIGIGTWFCDGVMLYESATLVDEVTLDAPGVLPRIDVIYGTFTYETDASPTAATYSILKGTAGSVPVEPSVITNQVKIAAIYIPSTAGDLDDCSIEQAYTLKEQLRMVLGVKVEGNLWIEAEVDPFLTTGHPTETLVRSTQIQDGDLLIETGGLDLFIYDADNNQWVTSAVLSHASTHSCASSDPLDVKDLCDTLSYLHRGTKTVHDALGLSHASLSSVTANQHHAQDHSSRHSCGADDSLDVKDVCDTGGYLHKHATALAGCPHGNECHSTPFADDPHTHAAHSGVIARGQAGFVSLTDALCAGGAEFWIADFPVIEVADTDVKITALYIKVNTAPTANVIFTVKKNAVTLATMTLLSGAYSVTEDIVDVTISNGDTLIFDAAVDTKDLKGLRFYAAIERSAAA